MNSKDIYKILENHKSHNPHHLKRYLDFILRCQENNKIKNITKNLEKHHICPQGKKFFPQYKSFKQNPWNCATLTYRQHFIAHYILAKAYGGYAWNSFYMLVNCINKTNNQRIPLKSNLYEIVKIKYKFHGPSKETIKKIKANRKGKTKYKSLETKQQYHLHKDDPLIKELGLVGITKGIKTGNGCNRSYVTCIDTRTNEKCRVKKEEFDKCDYLVGVRKGKKPKTYGKKILMDKLGNVFVCDLSDYEYYFNLGCVGYSHNKGKCNKVAKGSKWMHNNEESFRVRPEDVEDYEKNGFLFGRISWKTDS